MKSILMENGDISDEQPDFQAMSQKELQRYVLSHREDQAAFYAYVDKLNADANWIEMPPLSSVEDMDNPHSN